MTDAIAFSVRRSGLRSRWFEVPDGELAVSFALVGSQAARVHRRWQHRHGGRAHGRGGA